ncbi:MAG: HAD-IA family hydrolase [Acidimicrobiales bacterium]|nr:HAD-IA family hydrolase [Acidimicrobiales bacterium]
MSSLGRFDAVVFDTDGVLTDTAVVHAAAWQRLFDEFFERWAGAATGGAPQAPFDPVGEYLALVDGKPRYDGVRSVLAARGIELPEGDPDDEPGVETVCGLGNAKDAYFHERMRADGVRAFADARRLLDRLEAGGRRSAVVSASRNAREVLATAGLLDRFAVVVDGVDSDRLGLAGKPDPALFLTAADGLGVPPHAAVVVEDAVAGVEAGRRGGFGLVVGVDRVGQAEHLHAAGAHLVLPDLDHLHVEAEGPTGEGDPEPGARPGPGG